MKHSTLGAISLLALGLWATGAKADSCAEFNKLAAKTYNFDLSTLTEKNAADLERRLDVFWKTVTARKQDFLPCLEKSVADPKSNSYQRFDGANLLMQLSPTDAHKKLLISVYSGTNIRQALPERWVMTLAWLGSEGYDISPAAERWMREGFKYYPNGGEYMVGEFRATLTLFASMQEETATPVLARIAKDPKHPGQGAAIAILGDQWTDESRKVLRELDPNIVPEDLKRGIARDIGDEPLVLARTTPKTSRAEILRTLEAFMKGDAKPFFRMVDKDPDGEKDAVAVLTPEDLPLLRQVRRRFIAKDNETGYSYYVDFTRIIATVYLKGQKT
jgi:hypothetical protein